MVPIGARAPRWLALLLGLWTAGCAATTADLERTRQRAICALADVEGRLDLLPAGPGAVGARLGERGLALGLGGYRAGVEDHRALKSGRGGMVAHDFRFESVQPAAEGDYLGRTHSSKPIKLVATGPVIRT